MQAVLPALKKSPAQDKAVPSKPGTPKHGSGRQVAAGPKPGSTPLRDLSNGSKPARSSASPPLKDCAKSGHAADKKAVSGGTAATRLAGSRLDQPAAASRLLSASKESKSLTSGALDQGKSHSSSSSTGMQAFSKGMSPHGLVKDRAAFNIPHHPKSRRAADASSRTVSSTGNVSTQSTTQTQPSHFSFSPFRSVKGQQPEGQQEKSKAAPQLAALATTWSNPMFAYSTTPPSFCGSAQASSAVPDDHTKPEARGPLPPEPAQQTLNTAAAKPKKSSPTLDNLIRQMQRLGIAASCSSSSPKQKPVLPRTAVPADALRCSADAAQASSAPAGILSSSHLSMPSQSTPGASSADQAALLVAELLPAEEPAACLAENTGRSVSVLSQPSGTHQHNADVRFGSYTSDCEQPDLAGAVGQTAQAGVSSTDLAQGAAATVSTDEPQAAAAAITGQTPFVSATKGRQHAAAAAAAGLEMSGLAGRPMMASTPAASEASDASHAELYAMLDAGLVDSPSPTAGRFSSDAPAVGRRNVSPVPFGPLSSWTVADEDALQATAAMGSFSQAAVQTEGIPDFDNAHSVLADQILGDVMSLDEMLVGFDTLLTPSSPQRWDASAASQEAVLQAGLLPGIEAMSINAHQHGGSQAADNPSVVVSEQASSEPAFPGAHAVELLAEHSSFLDLR